MMRLMAAALAASLLMAGSASATTNLLKNGSFEQAGTTGTGAFTGWTKSNTPSNIGPDQPASVIAYNSGASYPDSAYGESVFPDTTTSASPDAIGGHAAYFVGDYSVNETLSQFTYLKAGNYRIGFSYFLTQNGLNNPNNASLDATIIGIPVASTSINNSSTARNWVYATGVGQISRAGYYRTALVFNSNGYPSKDVVIDRVFAITTNDPATVIIPPTPSFVPEPASWAMLIMGFGLIGAVSRRRRVALA
ncbi:MAG: PEPxxWA-CTERM sorting domain-containing protein [Sphingomonadales bacterium]|jgi:hypothetical protein